MISERIQECTIIIFKANKVLQIARRSSNKWFLFLFSCCVSGGICWWISLGVCVFRWVSCRLFSRISSRFIACLIISIRISWTYYFVTNQYTSLYSFQRIRKTSTFIKWKHIGSTLCDTLFIIIKIVRQISTITFCHIRTPIAKRCTNTISCVQLLLVLEWIEQRALSIVKSNIIFELTLPLCFQ